MSASTGEENVDDGSCRDDEENQDQEEEAERSHFRVSCRS